MLQVVHETEFGGSGLRLRDLADCDALGARLLQAWTEELGDFTSRLRQKEIDCFGWVRGRSAARDQDGGGSANRGWDRRNSVTQA